MMQNRVLAVYFSIIRRSAICAVDVMASASSRTINLNDARDEPLEVVGGPIEKICFVPRRHQPCPHPIRMTESARTRKSLDLLANYVNASVITSVEFQHHLSHVFTPIYPPCQRQNRGCFPGSWRSIEKQMRQTLTIIQSHGIEYRVGRKGIHCIRRIC